ncbi:Holliday junction resolvase YqgF [Thermovirga lienii DSM 17291]|jgi:putative Holliday junction resolvase|uniref:Putative pre-16S rRNA nuclease n=1 Tax=Thermovirga lienii (strain ATCC BAA-1197 / DSM 17291 / Cas60314) TaxID=580340 RepID=G7V9Q6_THELD|nr:Holliday junction resolvase RuvX [Thermovirga lienii]AER66606.1 Holliday junction resolvase YqgF [Thermovirga lienii DSM 17291]
MKRFLGLDIGTKRIGVSVSDPLGSFAQGVAVLDATRDWMAELDKLVAHYKVGVIVVGMPYRTDASVGPEALKIKDVVSSLRQRYPDLDVVLWDERFTTTIAEKAMIEADVKRKKRRQNIDMVAASIMLQDFLEHYSKGGS